MLLEMKIANSPSREGDNFFNSNQAGRQSKYYIGFRYQMSD